MPELALALIGCDSGHDPSSSGSTHDVASSVATAPTAATGSSLTTGSSATTGAGGSSRADVVGGRDEVADGGDRRLADLERRPRRRRTEVDVGVAPRLGLAHGEDRADDPAEVRQSLDPPQPLPNAHVARR